MNDWYEQAVKKLKAEKRDGSYDKYAKIMKDAVCESLELFCRQDVVCAQAVVQGGTLGDCMQAVAKDCGNGISDLEAFRRAVQFYFPGADIKFHMTINLCAGVEDEAELRSEPKRKILSLEDFL